MVMEHPKDGNEQLKALVACIHEWKQIEIIYRSIDKANDGDKKLKRLYIQYVRNTSATGVVDLPPIGGRQTVTPPVRALAMRDDVEADDEGEF
jgi:hypothetical protein